MNDTPTTTIPAIQLGERVYDSYRHEYGTLVVRAGAYHWVLEIEGSGELVIANTEDLIQAHELSGPEFGMSSADLAGYVAEAITRATSRVVGVGQDQYDQGDHQKFETLSLDEMVEMSLEELDDVIVYSVMQQIRVRRIWDELRRRGAQ